MEFKVQKSFCLITGFSFHPRRGSDKSVSSAGRDKRLWEWFDVRGGIIHRGRPERKAKFRRTLWKHSNKR